MHSIRRALMILLSAGLVFAGGMLAGRLRAQQPASTPSNPSPFYVTTFVDLIPPNRDGGVALLKQYLVDTGKAPGIQRVEGLVQLNRTNHFLLYEAWQSQEAFNKHEADAATREFRSKIQPMLGAPFDQRLHFKLE